MTLVDIDRVIDICKKQKRKKDEEKTHVYFKLEQVIQMLEIAKEKFMITNQKEYNMVTTVKFAKVRPEAIIPTKRAEDAGYDIYPCFEDDFIIIPPHKTVMIPTGIASACDTDYCFILKERGSTGSKGLAQRCGLIDSGYRGEWFVPITNTNDTPFVISKKHKVIDFEVNGHNIYPYEKAICQALVIPVPTVDVEEYTYEELKAIPSKRGVGALGSSGK